MGASDLAPWSSSHLPPERVTQARALSTRGFAPSAAPQRWASVARLKVSEMRANTRKATPMRMMGTGEKDTPEV